MLRQVLLPLAFLAVTAATAFEPRRARQLDLGPPTNQLSDTPGSPRESSFQQPGYLPPVEPAGAQDDPVVLRPTTVPPQRPTHHGRDLCTDPFHSFLCANLKTRRPITGALPNQRILEADGNNLSGANTFLEPSKVLAPPLNDLVDPSTTTTRRPITTTYRTTTSTRRPTTTTTTTTPRPTTTTRRPTTTTTTRRPTTTTTTTERAIGPEASNDVRSYLPPEPIAPAAAQQDLTVVKPDATDEEHHHHHPHHHGRDLCSDPFHSFLCEPLKPRKRITGNLPNSLQGQNTFLTPQKVRPDPDISPQPSNEIDRAYLPPATTTRRPTTTTTRRPIEPQPSNEVDNVYLPPVTTRRPPPPPPPPATTRRPTTTTRRTTTIRFRPEPSNEIERAYLPPSTTRRPPPPLPPTTTRRPPPPPPTTRRPPPPPPTTTRRPATTTIRFRPEPSNEIDRTYLPPVAPQPSNIDNNYLRPDPKIEPAAAQNDPAIAAPDHDHDHHHGSHGFKDICSDPFHSFLCTVPKPRTRITGALPDRFRNNIVSPAPSNIDLTRVRILEHKSDNLNIVVIPKDSQAPQPSQQQDTRIPPPGYSLPRPENKLTLPSETKEVGIGYRKPSSPAPATTNGYSYPKPERKLSLPSQVQPQVVSIPITPRARPTTTTTVGYSYPKPEKKLPLPSEVRPQVVTGYNYPKPTTTPGYDYPTPLNKFNLPSESKQVIGYDYPKPTKGYDYPKPEVKLPLPSENKPVIGYDYPKPTVGFPEPTKGYDYPKPDLKLTLPSEIKPVIGYDYPKPSVGLPEPTKGYDYPKPELKLTLPSENKPVVGYDYPKPSVGLPEPTKGYDYPKPDSRLTLPSEQNNVPRPKPTFSSQNRSPDPFRSSTNPLPLSQSRNSLPSSLKEARERLQGLQGTKVDKISNISNQNSVSDLIPVNQVEFPEDGGLSVRFGERLKRRQRKSYLLPPPGSHQL